MRRYDELSKDQELLLPRQFCSDCIIATRGYDSREGHLCVGRPGAARPARRPRAARQRQLSRTAAGGQNVVPLKRRKQLGVIPLFRSGR